MQSVSDTVASATTRIGPRGGQVQVPLDFLGKGRFRATIWQDGAAVTDVATTERTVAAVDVVSLAMAASGGGVIRLTPLD